MHRINHIFGRYVIGTDFHAFNEFIGLISAGGKALLDKVIHNSGKPKRLIGFHKVVDINLRLAQRFEILVNLFQFFGNSFFPSFP